MEVTEVITQLKAYHYGIDHSGEQIVDETSRDQVLYGNTEQECTGIVTTVFASIDVINKAVELGANLIIVHEALFWNHGDHQDWLKEAKNQTYLTKKDLLDHYGIVVWRNHDYVHSGIPMTDGSYVDGIFYGFAKEMSWENNVLDDSATFLKFELPETTAKDLANDMIKKLNLEGARIIGDPETKIRKVRIPSFHIFGDANDQITEMDRQNIDALLALELVDFSIHEYVRDSSMLGLNKAIITVGHFNMEEPGMKYMATYIPKALDEVVPCHFVQSGDTAHYIC